MDGTRRPRLRFGPRLRLGGGASLARSRALAAQLREKPSAAQLAAITLSVLFLLALLFGLAWQRCFFDGCPDVGRLEAYQPGGAPVLLDRTGRPFADLSPPERRMVPLHKLPQHVAQAFLAVEDRRFFAHGGVDWRRVGGATLANLRAGSFEEGFSTLSMQLARNVFPDRLPGQERSPRRKLLEVRVAQEIEARFTKDEILELYLNHIYFGGGARGIQAAADRYFDVPAERLDLAQAALLAALPKAPSHYEPFRYPRRARERRNLVLTLMEQQRRVPARAADEARRAPLGLSRGEEHEEDPGFAPYFVAEVRRRLEESFGGELYDQPLLVQTTLDRNLQKAAEEELKAQLRAIEAGKLGSFDGPRRGEDGAIRPDGEPAYLQGAAVAMEVGTGDVLAWVGGRDFRDSQFDRAARGRRQAGSAFKPFVYAAALAQGLPLSEPLADRPLRVRFRDGRVWQPRNFTGRYEGEVTLRDALVRSKNVATVRLSERVGIADVATLARQVGIEEPVPELPSSALGTVAVSPLELTSAYTAFAGLGTAVEPRFVLEVRRLDGKVIWRPKPRRRQVLDPAVAYLIDDILHEALERGSGTEVREAGFRAAAAAGKTGTTNEGADAWFVGYTPKVATGIWIGFDRPRAIANGATGGRLAAPVWGRLMARFYERRPAPEPWQRPQRVVELPFDAGSGRPLADGCPGAGKAPRELFIEGNSPDPVCPAAPAIARRQILAQRDEEAPAEPAPKVQPGQPVEAEKRAAAAARSEEDDDTAAEERASGGLTGWWEVTNVIESTSYPVYTGLRLGYRIYIEQQGDRIVGHGTKQRENGRRLPSAQRTPISLTGSLDGGTARVLFTERGARRTSQGSFLWKVRDGGDALSGSFASGAAASRGSSVGRRSAG